MQAKSAKVEDINSVQKRLTITVPSEDVNTTFQVAWQKIRKKTNIRGFRPGKAPLSVVKKLYEGQGTQEVQETLVNKHLIQSIDENSLKPIASPIIDAQTQPKCDEDYVFTAVIDLWPELDLKGSYKELPVTSKSFSFDDSDVERELKVAALRHAKDHGPAEPGSKAGEGDEVTISTVAKRDEKMIPELSKTKIPCVLGYFQARKEIETAVLGLKAGDKAEVKWSDKANPVDSFEVTLHEIKKLEIPERTDEFAKDLGLNNLEELKQQIRDHLQRSCDEQEKAETERVVLEAMSKQIEFQVPPSIIENVIDNMILQSGVIQDEKHKSEALADEKLRKYLQSEAEGKARKNIILRKFIEDESLEVTDSEVDAVAAEILKSRGQKGPLKDKELESLRPKIRENVLYDKALKKLISYVKVTKIPTKIWVAQ